MTDDGSALRAQALIPALPPLPPLVRYYDDFDEKYRTVRDLAATDAWAVVVDGQNQNLKLAVGEAWHTHLLKVFVADLLANRATKTATSYASSLATLQPGLLVRVLEAIALEGPRQFRDRWIFEFHGLLRRDQMRPIRYMATAAARLGIGQWTAGDDPLVKSLPGAPLDKYARVRAGECFLPLSAQSEIVGYIDDIAASARRQDCGADALRLACVLGLSYQYGLRPGQIARVKEMDVRLFSSGSVHVSIVLLKQRGERRERRVTRAIQREWCVLFQEFFRLRTEEFGPKLFGCLPTQVTALVLQATEEIVGESYTPSDLRHTAAQRLVDGGASREQVSDFLGHTNKNAANVYFDTSAKQAELVNAALGLSDIYRNVVEAARTRTIPPHLLQGRPADQQVGGTPHGIPVTGLGLCKAGQSLCQRNPVLACYTCHKFLPVTDVTIHAELLVKFRDVVKSFERPDHVDRVQPAMLQLRSTLEALQRLVDELSSGGAGAF